MTSIHHLEDIYSTSSQRVSVSIRWNNARLTVNLIHSPPGTHPPSIEDSFVERWQVASEEQNDAEADALQDEILSAVVPLGRATFDELAPQPTTNFTDLHTLRFPDTFTFQFQTVDGRAQLLRSDDEVALFEPFGGPFELQTDPNCKLPRYSTRDVQVIEDLMASGYIARVRADGKEMCSKTGDNKGPEATQRELDCLWKIISSPNASTIRVPKLLGLIEAPDGNNAMRTVGFLMEYIEVPDDWELSTLGSIDDVSNIPESRRKKWAAQIQETISQLHEIGVTWGDGKPSNVLIHRDTDDAWVIDFGGSWTDGWVTPELSGTLEGDELAVRKIREFLEVGRRRGTRRR